MQSLNDFIVRPVGNARYNNSKKIAGVDFVTNTKIEAFQNVNREAIVLAIPRCIETDIQVNDKVIVHHNVFRRFYDIRGKEKNGRSYMFDDMYAVAPDQIYARKPAANEDDMESWQALHGYCFVQPIRSGNYLDNDNEKKLHGILKYPNKELSIPEGSVVCFTPDSEFEFVFNGMLLYCMKSNNIVLSYGNQRNEKEYNPSWAQSC